MKFQYARLATNNKPLKTKLLSECGNYSLVQYKYYGHRKVKPYWRAYRCINGKRLIPSENTDISTYSLTAIKTALVDYVKKELTQ